MEGDYAIHAQSVESVQIVKEQHFISLTKHSGKICIISSTHGKEKDTVFRLVAICFSFYIFSLVHFIFVIATVTSE